jgi:hypothetical protein
LPDFTRSNRSFSISSVAFSILLFYTILYG